jgi:hypothetical protein
VIRVPEISIVALGKLVSKEPVLETGIGRPNMKSMIGIDIFVKEVVISFRWLIDWHVKE